MVPAGHVITSEAFGDVNATHLCHAVGVHAYDLAWYKRACTAGRGLGRGGHVGHVHAKHGGRLWHAFGGGSANCRRCVDASWLRREKEF